MTDHRITTANARSMAAKSAESRRNARDVRADERERLRTVAGLSVRERAAVEAAEHFTAAMERLGALLSDPDVSHSVALNAYWQLVEQAHGRPTQAVEVSTGPIVDIESIPTAALEQRLSEIRLALQPADAVDD